jgi:hypothetical protein
MKKLFLIITLITLSANALAFCNLNDQACRQSEQMLRLQQEQIRQQQAYQQEQLRLQQQQMANSAFGSSGGHHNYDPTNGRSW